VFLIFWSFCFATAVIILVGASSHGHFFIYSLMDFLTVLLPLLSITCAICFGLFVFNVFRSITMNNFLLQFLRTTYPLVMLGVLFVFYRDVHFLVNQPSVIVNPFILMIWFVTALIVAYANFCVFKFSSG